jgi:ABC-2 type transport system ATP-binding protein
MWEIIRGLVRDGSTVLLTTQYLDEADQLADRIAVIDRGKVVAEGTADELKNSVGDASLHLRLGDLAQTEVALDIVATVLGSRGMVAPELSRITAPMSDPDRVTDLLVALRERGIHLVEMSVQKPTLDEVFLTITGHGVEPEVQYSEEAA